MQTYTSLIKHIRNLRESAGVSQQDIAILLNIDEKNYGELERGKRKRLDLFLMIHIAKVLALDLKEVLSPLLLKEKLRNPNHSSVKADMEKLHEHMIRQITGIIRYQQSIIDEQNRLLISKRRAQCLIVLNQGYQ